MILIKRLSELARVTGLPSSNSKETQAVILVVATAGFGGHLVIQLLNIKLHVLGVSSFLIGISTAAQAFGIVLGAWFALLIMRTRGVRFALMFGIALASAVLVAFPLCTNYVSLLVLRLGYGVALALVFTASEYVVLARAPESTRGGVVGLYATALVLGASAGPAITALLGLSADTAFILCAGIVLIGLLPVRLAVEERLIELRGSEAIPWAWLLRVGPLGFACAFIFGVLDNGPLSMISVLGMQKGLDAADATLLIAAATLGAIVCQIPIGRMVDRYQARLVFLVCSTITSALLLTLNGVWVDKPTLLLSLFLLGAVIEGFYTIGLTDIGRRIPRRGLAAANAAFIAICGFGEIVGPIMAGASLEDGGTKGFVLAPVIIVLAFAAFALDQRNGGRRQISERALARVEGEASVVDCLILDQSHNGARLQLDRPLPEGFRLLLPADAGEADCEVMWRRGDEVGVRFTGPLARPSAAVRKRGRRPEPNIPMPART